MWRPPIWMIWLTAAFLGAGDLVALSAISGIQSSQMYALAGSSAVCRWGITAGYGQSVCGSWGIAPFPATSAKPVAVWLAPSILSGLVPLPAPLRPHSKPKIENVPRRYPVESGQVRPGPGTKCYAPRGSRNSS